MVADGGGLGGGGGVGDGVGIDVVDFTAFGMPLSLWLNSESSPVCRCSHAFFR